MPKKPKRPNMMWLYFSLIMLLIGLFMLEGTSDPGQTSSLPFFSESAAAKKDLSYTDLQAYMEKDVIESVVVYDNAEAKAKVKKDQQVVVFGQAAKDLKGDAVIEVQTPGVQEFNAYLEELNKTREEQGLKKIDVSFKKDHNYLYFILVNILPFVLLILFFVWMSRGAGSMSGGIFGVGKAKAQVFDKNKKDKVTFKDVAGRQDSQGSPAGRPSGNG